MSVYSFWTVTAVETTPSSDKDPNLMETQIARKKKFFFGFFCFFACCLFVAFCWPMHKVEIEIAKQEIYLSLCTTNNSDTRMERCNACPFCHKVKASRNADDAFRCAETSECTSNGSCHHGNDIVDNDNTFNNSNNDRPRAWRLETYSPALASLCRSCAASSFFPLSPSSHRCSSFSNLSASPSVSSSSSSSATSSQVSVNSIVVALLLITVATAIGTLGYLYLEGLSFADAFLNACMVLSGCGQLAVLKHTSAKIFAAFYGLFSGLVFIALVAIILSTTLHAFGVALGADVPQETTRRNNARF